VRPLAAQGVSAHQIAEHRYGEPILVQPRLGQGAFPPAGNRCLSKLLDGVIGRIVAGEAGQLPRSGGHESGSHLVLVCGKRAEDLFFLSLRHAEAVEAPSELGRDLVELLG
jgi:hypothetical protein